MSIDGEDLTSVGKLFHKFGAHTENALSPKVVVLDLVVYHLLRTTKLFLTIMRDFLCNLCGI